MHILQQGPTFHIYSLILRNLNIRNLHLNKWTVQHLRWLLEMDRVMYFVSTALHTLRVRANVASWMLMFPRNCHWNRVCLRGWNMLLVQRIIRNMRQSRQVKNRTYIDGEVDVVSLVVGSDNMAVGAELLTLIMVSATLITKLNAKLPFFQQNYIM